MNTPTPLEVPTLLRLLFDSSWQAGLLVLVVVGVQRLLRGRLTPAWHHALWWIVLGRLLIPVPPASSWSLFNLLPTPRSHHTLPTGRLPVSSGWQPLLAPFLSAPPVADSSAASAASEAGVATLTPTQTPPPAVRRAFPAKALGLVWALVAIFLLGRLALQGFWFSRRAQAFMRPAEPEVLALFEECRVRMGVGRHVQLLQGDVVASPAVFGILRPRLLLPQHIAGTYPPDRLRHILLHELAHVRRGDLLVHALTRVLQALHWFNPVLAWAFRRLRADREIASDALALEVAGEQESRAYGLTIVQLLQHWATRPTHPGTVGILEDGRSLERRIRAIAHYRRPSRWAPAAGIVMAALAAASWTSAQPHPPGGEPPPAAAGSKSVEESIRPDADPPSGLGSGTNAVSRGRQRILSSLESIRIPQVGFDRVPLKVVVRQLKEMARTYDPNGTGMNFFIHPELHPSRGQDPQAPPDSATGQTIQPLEPEPVPLGDVLVRIHPPMRDVRLIDALLEVARSADAPILFNVEDYAVVFFMKPPLPGTQATRPVGSNPDPLAGGITWQPWSRGAVEAARAARRPVLVHFTADWCLTCKVNEHSSIEVASVRERLRRMDAVTLKGDHTRMSREITDELQRFGRAGLPLVLVYPRDAAREPEVLPEVLSPDLVLDALDRADQGTSPVANLAPTAPVRPEDTARSIELLHRYAQAVASLDDLLTRYRGKWPAVVEARSRVEALRFELAQGPFSTDAPSAQPVPPLDSPSRPAPHILILSHDGSWTLNGHPLHPAHRESQLRQALARQPASTAVLQVRSDRRVSFRDLAEAMDLSTKVGFTNISVAPVLIPDRESAPE